MSQRVYMVSQQLIANNVELIAAKSWEGYRQVGRGVILIDGGTLEAMSPEPMAYLSTEQVQEAKEEWPAENIGKVLEKYVPETEMIVVVKWRGEVGMYRLKPPIAPPTAYENCKEILAGAVHRANLTLLDP